MVKIENSRILVLIATFNRKKYLEKVLQNIFEQVGFSCRELSILAISAGSSDGTDDFIINNYPTVKLIIGEQTWWWTECMNAGFQYALEQNYDFVLILNDDIEIDEHYFRILFNDYSSLAETCILGSVSLDYEIPHRILSSGSSSFNRLFLKPIPYHSIHSVKSADLMGIHPTYNLSGRGTLIPTSIFQNIGVYDQKLVQYGSDDEFILRARKSGFNAYISWNAVIYNHSKLTSYAAAHQRSKLKRFLKSFFDIHSVNSVRKQLYLYQKYGYTVLFPFYLVYFILGAFYAQYIKYKGFPNT